MGNSTSDALIIPAIMPEHVGDIRTRADRYASFAPWVHLDVMDGVFVPSTSWPYREGEWQELEAGTTQLPAIPRVEAHLMVADPESIGVLLAHSGAARIIMHAEVLEHIARPFTLWRSAGALEVGCALLLTTSIDVIDTYIADIDFVQVMGIERVGYQGQSFDPRALGMVAALNERYPSLPIAVDGGVNGENIAALRSAGVSRFVVGSALGSSEDASIVYEQLRTQLDIAPSAEGR